LGLLVAYFLTRTPELRRLRLVKLVLLPLAFAAAVSTLPDPANGYSSVGSLMGFFVVLGFIGILLAPNIAFICGAALSNLIDPQDWTPAEQEIALRPIIKLIDKDRYEDALSELESLLRKHKPTYEALHLKAKLVHHFQYYDKTRATLLEMLPMSNTVLQQLVVMDLLATLDAEQPGSGTTSLTGPSQVRITHELLLFESGANDRSNYKVIPPGTYDIEDALVGNRRWLMLKGESWGNADSCWQAVQKTNPATESAVKTGFFQRMKGKSRIEIQREVQSLHKAASQLLRQGDFAAALPLLQKASEIDPDNYEVACRLVQAAWHVGPTANPAKILSEVLGQSLWTDDQAQMLKQLKP
jgi:tetratricopeptide (TPR) repeat protein